MTANQYQQEVENVANQFIPGGQNRICCIFSDNTAACIKARELNEATYRGVASINDATHLVDLLMKDIGKLKWIQEVIDIVVRISTIFHQKKNLRDLFKELAAIRNHEVSSYNKEK